MTNMAQSSFFDPSRLSAQAQARADEAVAALEAMADPERATGMASYMRDKFEFFGIASQPRKDAVKHILSGRSLDWDFVAALWLHPQRECQYVAVDHVRLRQAQHRGLGESKVRGGIQIVVGHRGPFGQVRWHSIGGRSPRTGQGTKLASRGPSNPRADAGVGGG